MARAICTFDSGAVSVTANTTKTLLGLTAPANQACAWLRAVISFEGVAATDKPALIEWGSVTGGTSAGGTEQLIQSPGGALTPQGAALTYSVEPTWTVKGSVYCHLQSGYEVVFQRGQDEVAYYNATWAIRVTNPTGNSTTNARATLWWEE
jgi:hypothetical protein